jgi:hypothetical protein
MYRSVTSDQVARSLPGCGIAAAPRLNSARIRPLLSLHGFLTAALFLAGILLPAVAWSQQPDFSAFTAFSSWTGRYQTAVAPVSRIQLLSEGVSLAKARRAAFAQLIRTNPEAALTLAVPASVRNQLPAAVNNELETPVSAIGDYTVLGALAAKDGPQVEPVQRLVQLNGREYVAYVYGRRAGETTKRGIPLHGAAVDGVLALHEAALVELGPDDAAASTQPVVDLRSPAEQSTNGASVLAEMGGTLYQFASREKLQQAEALIEGSEDGVSLVSSPPAAAIVEQTTNADGGTLSVRPKTAQSEGPKKVLVIRVDFSDLPGDPKFSYGGSSPPVYTAAYVQNLMDTQISPYYAQSSYGITSLSNTVTTNVYRMPQLAAYYATNNANTQLHTDAETAAAADYTLAGYDRIIVVFSGLGGFAGSKITYGGLSDVGGPDVWVNGEFDFRVVAHELGHTYGLLHANLWQVGDGNPISATGTNVEYGDDFDTMGANYANDQRTDFNPWFKNRLNWIPNAQVLTVTNSGIYRVKRFDNAAATGTLALKVKRESTHNYWIGCRRKFTNNGSLQNGAYIIWGYNINEQSDLLDMTTPGSSDHDAALALGTAFLDPAVNLTIIPVAEGGTSPNEYMDVQITFGQVPQLTQFAFQQGAASFHLNGPAGSNYVVEASSNFSNWSPFSTNTIPGIGFVLVTDPGPADPARRFYRAIPQAP